MFIGGGLIFITDKNEWLQFFLPDDLLHPVTFVECLMLIYIEDFVGSTETFDGLEVEQKVV